MGAVPLSRTRKYLVEDSEDAVDDVTTKLELRAIHADLRALEDELFNQYARGVRDASRRLVKK
ncbi:MAG TPA: hypothetical protein VGB18_02075 [Candidatus Thermoplasmatota archaeon]